MLHVHVAANKKESELQRLTDDKDSNQGHLPDPKLCRTWHPEQSLDLWVCMLKGPNRCDFGLRLGSTDFCRHPDRPGFEKTAPP
jgi:hypothetical protein